MRWRKLKGCDASEYFTELLHTAIAGHLFRHLSGLTELSYVRRRGWLVLDSQNRPHTCVRSSDLSSDLEGKIHKVGPRLYGKLLGQLANSGPTL